MGGVQSVSGYFGKDGQRNLSEAMRVGAQIRPCGAMAQADRRVKIKVRCGNVFGVYSVSQEIHLTYQTQANIQMPARDVSFGACQQI